MTGRYCRSRFTRSFQRSLLVAPMLLAAAPGFAADHREAPLAREDGTADINDIYAFLNPNDDSRVVLAMTVNPFSAPSENFSYNFSPNVLYTFKIDSDGDAVEDTVIDVSFADQADGSQTYGFIVNGMKVDGAMVTAGTDEPKPNPPIINNGPGGIASFAGQRDDPFFFDVVGFTRFLNGTGGFDGSDGFAGYNVSAIVIELPRTMIDGGSDQLQVWGETSRRLVTVRKSEQGAVAFDLGPFQQIERMGNPAINTALVPSGKKDLFNIGDPADDAADFAGDLVASLQALGTNDENIGILASVAVPDTLKLDLSAPSAYPNGRAPQDDVIDTLFFFIFNQTPVTDQVDGNDMPFLNSFPYLAAPHQP